MRYGSVCSGIEAATAAWHHMGWEPAFFSEIEAFPRAVLEHHYPEVPLHGDFTTIEQNQYGKIDLLVGGTPCQSFSVAGLRGGLDDDRGNLALEFCRLAQREQPRWIVWENVPGVLSSSGGRDFGSILGALEDLGYGLAYRVLDAQYFGVAQRRRRVFVVGYLGDWRPAAAVLFERHSMSGHPAPSREARKEAARAASVSTHECGGIGSYNESDVSSPLLRSGADKGHGCEALIAGGDGLALTETVGTLSCNTGPNGNDAGNFACNQAVDAGHVLPVHVETVGTLRTRRPGEGGVQGDFDHVVPVVSPALNTQSGSHHAPDTKAYVVTSVRDTSPTITSNYGKQIDSSDTNLGPNVVYSIMPMNSGKDYKARETEVAQPIMAAGPVGGNQGGDYIVTPFDTTQITSPHNYSSPKEGDPCHPLAAGAHPPAIAFSAKDHGGDATEELSPTLRAGGFTNSHQNGGVMPAVAIGFNGDQSEKTRSMGEKEEQSPTLRAGSTCHVAIGFDNERPDVFAFSSNMSAYDVQTDGTSPTLKLGGHGGGNPPAVAYDHPGRFNNIHGGSGEHRDVMPTLEATNPKQIVASFQPTADCLTAAYGTKWNGNASATNGSLFAGTKSAVRRLTPVECERLQGFPDNFTAIPWKKKGPEQCPDGPRYKALGNSMAVPVMRWIGERIQLVDDLISVL